MTSWTRCPASRARKLVGVQFARLGLVRLEAGAGIEVMRQLAGEGEVRPADGLALVDAALAGAAPAAANRVRSVLQRALDQREVQVALVLEVDVDQGAAEARLARHLHPW